MSQGGFVREQIRARKLQRARGSLAAVAAMRLAEIQAAASPTKRDLRARLPLVEYVPALSPRWSAPQHLALRCVSARLCV
jgi:hypothetical protein